MTLDAISQPAKKNTIFGYGIILFVGILIAGLVYFKTSDDYKIAIDHYQQKSDADAQLAAKNLTGSFAQLYQGIRTISYLPGVKAIDRYGKNLDANARESIIQIYNNMASNVAVSEVYIVPEDIEPERVDPVTGGLGEPILMFDDKATASSAPEAKPEDIKAEGKEASKVEAKKPVTTVEEAMKV
ncbi:MAG: hypothetical protein K2Q32_00855, partial [Alphaproteobacteria bacterium]|nr:hypothetical protein [Alphaproteobacteria bacterium]